MEDILYRNLLYPLLFLAGMMIPFLLASLMQ